ncbi:hypothetical protein CAEBREN_21953 [Caenorhabditis brenneri]|uniref:Arrestin C-terminal-like domain-containing protein n=1 Tax=Caenorhabditis brenneri TaxID=135651 RepID=G0MAI4_CAEBE|nr:hypothetical protein CAEBREN_21953 [Caenorhabditis brenneri]
MEHLKIAFLSPNGYVPGQSITGQVILESIQDISARYLKVCLRGVAYTKWGESEHRHRKRADGKDVKYTVVVNYSGETEIVSKEMIAWSANNGLSKLPPGQHTFPFSFLLPIDCPPSFEGFYGHIRYSIRAELDRPRESNVEAIVHAYDLNSFPRDNNPIVMEDSKDIGGIIKKGIVTMNVSIPKQAYAPSEQIPITIKIDNKSKRPATCVYAELHQTNQYSGKRMNDDASCTHSPVNSTKEHYKIDKEKKSESRKNVKLEPKCQGHVELQMKIPKLPPTFQYSIVNVEYLLSVSVITETSQNNILNVEIPIVIGTVPIGEASKTDLLPPAYLSGTPSAPMLPPTYEESMNFTKI